MVDFSLVSEGEFIEGLAFVGNRLFLLIGQTGKVVVADQFAMLAFAALAVIAGVARKTITTPTIIPAAIAAVEVVMAYVGSLHGQTFIQRGYYLVILPIRPQWF